jgi:serine/threonine protein kinase
MDKLLDVDCLSEHDTKLIIRQLVEAVAYIHDQKVIHGDINPENILI